MENNWFDILICDLLNIDVSYFKEIVSRMVEEDWQYLYFYSGRFIGTDKRDEEDINVVKKLISKYQRKEKIKKLKNIDDECSKNK